MWFSIAENAALAMVGAVRYSSFFVLT